MAERMNFVHPPPKIVEALRPLSPLPKDAKLFSLPCIRIHLKPHFNQSNFTLELGAKVVIGFHLSESLLLSKASGTTDYSR